MEKDPMWWLNLWPSWWFGEIHAEIQSSWMRSRRRWNQLRIDPNIRYIFIRGYLNWVKEANDDDDHEWKSYNIYEKEDQVLKESVDD